MSKPRTARRKQEQQARQQLVAQLRIMLALAVLGGVFAGIVMTWDRLFPVAPEKLVTVYWTHECRCAAPWIRSLEAQGYAVREFEQASLQPIRRSLGTPERLRGCHVAAFMDYFVEGHVPAEALRVLAIEQPAGRGVAWASDLPPSERRLGEAQADDRSLLLFDDQGMSRAWIPAGAQASVEMSIPPL